LIYWNKVNRILIHIVTKLLPVML